jgi:hypothetical protein
LITSAAREKWAADVLLRLPAAFSLWYHAAMKPNNSFPTIERLISPLGECLTEESNRL